MRSLRAPWIFLLLAALPASALATWKSDCVATLQSDLKRQDLAKAIGLTYYAERPPGITRKVGSKKIVKETTNKKGERVSKEGVEYDVKYFDPKGKLVRDAETIAAYDELDIPKVYTDVWISPDPKSHVLAIAYDAKKRPQYSYHPLWDQATAVTKFIRMGNFGKQIADVRRAISKDLRSPGITKRRLLAAVSLILETGNIRVGSAKYVEENGSYGLTTLLQKHVKVDGPNISFDFIGKEGVHHQFTIANPDVADVIAALKRRKGVRLFEYVDDSGATRGIAGSDVKKYLAELSGGQTFTAKDFRTWQGTTAAAEKLIGLGAPLDPKDTEAKIKLAVEYASSVLRNTPSVARERYVYGLVLDAYADGKKFQDAVKWVEKNPIDMELSEAERLVLELIRRNTQ